MTFDAQCDVAAVVYGKLEEVGQTLLALSVRAIGKPS